MKISQIPNGYRKDYIDKIRNNIMTTNLIDQIDNLYNKFIHIDWKPIISKDILNEKTSLLKEYEELGTMDLNIKEITLLIKKQIIKWITVFLNKRIDFSNIFGADNGTNTLSGIDESFDKLDFNEYNDIYSKIYRITSANFKERSENLVQDLINSMVDFIFKDALLSYKLHRFNDLKIKIKQDMMVIYNKNYERKISNAKSTIYNHLNIHMMENKGSVNFKFDQYLDRYYKWKIVLPVFKAYSYNFTKEDFIEDSMYKLQRYKLEKKLQKITDHYQKIQEHI